MIDLAHLRKTVDWAAWLQVNLKHELAAGRTDMSYRCSEPSRYHLSVRYPCEVEAMTAQERADFEHDLSVRLALVTSYAALTWHEMLTWYGFSAVPGFSEKQSAFSSEDMYTHIVGIAVARRALEDAERPFDEAVTVALKTEIDALEPMNRKDTKAAVNEVKGIWWRYARTLKRFTDIGESGSLEPWLVDGFPCANPARYQVPDLRDIRGVDMTAFVTLEIEPVVRDAHKIFAAVRREGGRIEPVVDYPMIMTDIRNQMKEQYGDDVDDPHATTIASHLGGKQ
jgi:hypothetical protein